MDEYVLAKYLRLSMDDAITDSLSIPNQRRMLDNFIDGLDIPGVTVLEFVDNGFTGTNFERPAAQELLELVQTGRVDCIVCKDFSRFGRNAIETGYFIEQVFPLYQTRFISVDDRFDSDDYKETTGGLDIAFKHLAHEQYSRDLSEKVKSAKRVQMARGENIVANAIYGYRKNDSGKWEPDGEAAEVVRRIYAMGLDGLSPTNIRDRLFDERLPTPREYKTMKRRDGIAPSCMWTARMVTHILSNEQYTGMYISGKQVSKAVGSHSKIHTDKATWIQIPDRHPAIISKQDFDKAQNIRCRYKWATTAKPPRNLLMDDMDRPRRNKMISGERKPNNPIYSYIKGGDGTLVIDRAAAPIIRCMYQMAAEGRSVHDIRDYLTKSGHPTPSEHIRLGKGKKITPACQWTNKSVRGILQNVQYTGAYVSGKILKDYETGKKFHTAQSDWIILPGKHPAIVSQDLYDRVQDILTESSDQHRKKMPRDYLLRGDIVKCGCCGYALSYDDRVKTAVFRCHHTQADASAPCHKMKVSGHELDAAVLSIIEKQLQVVLGRDISKVRKTSGREQQAADCENQIQECIAEQQQVYERFVEQEIDRETYMALKGMGGTRLEKLRQQLSIMKAEEQAERSGQRVVSITRKLVETPASPRELVETLIKKIYVSPDNRVEVEWHIADFAAQIEGGER